MNESGAERIFNVFLDVADELIVSIGVQAHVCAGTDEEKRSLLQSAVNSDARSAIRFPLPENVNPIGDGQPASPNSRRLKWTSYLQLQEIGRMMDLIDPVLSVFSPPAQPFIVVTPVVNGQPKVDGVSEIVTSELAQPSYEFRVRLHFLQRYIIDGSFHFNRLINDDFFEPIKLLLNSRYIVPPAKLLLSAIDTFGFLAFGDEGNVFKRYSKDYIDVTSLKVTVEELWELRNALIHMTTYDSRRVRSNDVRRLLLMRGQFPKGVSNETFDGVYLNVDSLYLEIARSTERWGNDLFEGKRFDIETLVSRYETIISENHAWSVWYGTGI